MQNLDQLGLKDCLCFCMYFRFCFVLFCFVFFFSWPDVNLRLYPHNAPNLLASSRKGFTRDDTKCIKMIGIGMCDIFCEKYQKYLPS